jgi:hypothetical protein
MSRYYPTTLQLTIELPPLTTKAAELEAKLANVKADKAELKSVREQIRAMLHGPKQVRKAKVKSATKAKAAKVQPPAA